LLDGAGQTPCDLPVSELLGGRVRDALPVAWTLASGNTEQDIAEAEKMLDLRRHRVFKLKIGAGEVSADLAHVIAIKKPWASAPVCASMSTRPGMKPLPCAPARCSATTLST